MIKRTDGTTYTTSGLCLYNPQSPEHELMDRWDQEAIRIGGSPVVYYKINIKAAKIDPLYNEVRAKQWSPVGIRLCALFEPPQYIQEITPFGMDSPVDVAFTFNRQHVMTTVGELLAPGGLIFIEVDRTWWEIIQPNVNIAADLDRMKYGKHRLVVITRSYQPTATDHDPARLGHATNNTSFPIR